MSAELPLLVVSTNTAKVASFARRLTPRKVEACHLELVEPQLLDVADVAASKATQAWQRLQRPLVVEDGGLCVPALGGWPGAYTKPFLAAVGTDGLLALLGKRDPFAYFASAVAYHDAGCLKVFSGVSRRGRLCAARGGTPPGAWSSLWQVFIPEGSELTLAEMGADQVHATNPPGHPMAAFATWWADRNR